jgi:hypothetical protein
MRTLTTSLTTGLLTSALVLSTGCGQDDSLDLSGVPIASEEEKADVFTPGGRLFTWVRPSSTAISCIRTPCPKAIITDVNLAKSELAYAFDWRALGLSPEGAAQLEADAAKLLLYGKYATAKMNGESVQIYQVTRANPRVSEQNIDSPDSDRYYTVQSSNPSCQQPPCGYSGVLMNRLQSEQWSDVDLSRLGLPQNARQILVSELQKGSAYVSILSSSAMPVVSEAFRPYNASPLPND